MEFKTNSLTKFFTSNQNQLSHKEKIVDRLLGDNLISSTEAVVLLKTIDIQINADTLEMSSGAKIVGGSDFETNDFR